MRLLWASLCLLRLESQEINHMALTKILEKVDEQADATRSLGLDGVHVPNKSVFAGDSKGCLLCNLEQDQCRLASLPVSDGQICCTKYSGQSDCGVAMYVTPRIWL